MADIWTLMFDALLRATFNDFGLLILIIFIAFAIMLAKFRVPLVPSVVLGFVLLFGLASLVVGVFLPLLLILVLVGGIGLAFVFFRLGRS